MARFFCSDGAPVTNRGATTATGGVATAPAPLRKFRRPRDPVWRFSRLAAASRNQIARAAERRLRAEFVRQVPSAPGERVLAVVCDDTDAWIVATDRGLYHHQSDGSWSRTGWEQVTRVGWDGATQTLQLIVFGSMGLHRVVLRLPAPGPTVELVRERVASTVLYRTRVQVAHSGAAIVCARRLPGTGDPLWQVTLDAHLEPRDPEVQAGIAAAIDQLRSYTGC